MSTADGPVQRLIADVCLVGNDRGLQERALGHGVSEGDLAVIAAAPQRLALYRRLVRNGLLGVTAKMMPRTRARMNDLAGAAFDASFDAFLAEAAPRTHYLRDVPAEFLAWAAPRWAKNDSTPDYLADLAAYELVHFQIAAAPPLTRGAALTDLALDRGLVFCPASKLVRYAHAVHRLPEALEDRTEPPAGIVALVAYRDPENSVRFLEVTRLGAAIVERLFTGDTLETAMRAACDAESAPMTSDVLASAARMLADWGERGLLLGAAL